MSSEEIMSLKVKVLVLLPAKCEEMISFQCNWIDLMSDLSSCSKLLIACDL